MPVISGVHHLSLTVCNLDVSVPWYESIFGLTKVMDEPHEGGHAVVLMDPHSGLFIGLHAHNANKGEAFMETATGLDHASFSVAGRTALESWQEHLAAHGVHQSPITDAPYGSVLVFRDPDNIQLELFAAPGA
jgi:catechol 2,3-dioxygenase-like lactoylglutathione lyase family enzyme